MKGDHLREKLKKTTFLHIFVQITVPLGRVQHADVSQGPIQRSFGLGTLIIHTAGTQNSSVVLSGLSQTTAIELRDQIISQKRGNDVV